GTLKAVGYKNGRKAMETRIETTGEPAKLDLSADRTTINGDGMDLAVVAVKVLDKKGRFVPDANIELSISADGPVKILGAGNGDPAFRAAERPTDSAARSFNIKTFNGLAQILVQSAGDDGVGVLTVSADGVPAAQIKINVK
ncbi:MAG: beta-galactosidase, partial [Muribaculaceae bacterium]|nr:beta-galactosidase [Muribaculaceae bacterium]